METTDDLVNVDRKKPKILISIFVGILGIGGAALFASTAYSVLMGEKLAWYQAPLGGLVQQFGPVPIITVCFVLIGITLLFADRLLKFK